MCDSLVQTDLLCVIYCLARGCFARTQSKWTVNCYRTVCNGAVLLYSTNRKANHCRFTAQFPYFQGRGHRGCPGWQGALPWNLISHPQCPSYQIQKVIGILGKGPGPLDQAPGMK